MKVLHVISNLSGGGAERQFQYLVSGLAERGCEVHVAYIDDRAFRTANVPGVQFHCIAARGNYDPRILYNLFKLAAKIRPDIIQSWILQMDILSSILSRVCGHAWVVRESNAPSLRVNKGVKFALRDMLVGWSSAIVANSNSGYEYWNRKYPEKLKRVIRNGFPVEEIKRHRETVHLPMLKGRKYVLFVGRIELQKNVQALIRAMTYVTPDVCLVICGSGSQDTECKHIIEQEGLDDRVFMLGNLRSHEVYSLMRVANAFVLMSHFEGFPNVLIEAMLNKCPIVVSDIGPHREFLSNESAVFADKDDSKDIAETIMQVVNDPSGASERVEKAYAEAMKYSIEGMVGQYSALYESLVSA